VGGRAALVIKTGTSSEVSLGASAQYGVYDPSGRLGYLIAGGDVSFRIHRTALRAEYLVRRQQMDVTDPAVFKYVLSKSGGDVFEKHGAYVELEQPIASDLDVVGRVDGMYRVGNVLATSELSEASSVVRETLGFAYALDRNFRLKTSAELWEFSDRDPATGRMSEVSLHVGFVGTF
jgi:hypothetical protein